MAETRVNAFSLLGPYTAWMDETKGYRQSGDIGGPMNTGEGYRWNVPVLTYGFDPSFVKFFGSNGIAAVESAIAILNSLPPASQIDPSNYPPVTTGVNFTAASKSLLDLKSATLFLLVEHLGLAQPQRFVWTLQERYLPTGNNCPNYSYTVIQRNFDSATWSPSSNVNTTSFSYGTVEYCPVQNTADAREVRIDPQSLDHTAVADGYLPSGYFYQGLSGDDVGGLSYLLRTYNYNFESLLPDVHGVGTNAGDYVNGALRPGVDKITFVQHDFGSMIGQFVTVTNQFTDTYITNNVVMQQQVERVITQPDFLFCAGDLGSTAPTIPAYSRTGTTNWINNAVLNGSLTSDGPGVIQPPVRVVFHRLGQHFYSFGPISDDSVDSSLATWWGTFDNTTNPPIVYPEPRTGANQTVARMWLTLGNSTNQMNHRFEWPISGLSDDRFVLQASTNLINWISLGTITNNGSVFTYYHQNPASNKRFYRIVPE